jgi:hypothetical protein
VAYVTAVTVEFLLPGAYRVRVFTEPPPLYGSTLSAAPLLVTLRDNYWPEYAYQSAPASAYVGPGPDGTTACLVADFGFDDSNYYLAEWEIPPSPGLAFPDDSSLGPPTTGGFPYTAPLTAGELQAGWVPGTRILGASYTVLPQGGMPPYQSYSFTVFTFPDLMPLDYGSNPEPWYEFDAGWLLTSVPGQTIVIGAQVLDSNWTYSDLAFSAPLDVPARSCARPVMGLGLALAAP